MFSKKKNRKKDSHIPGKTNKAQDSEDEGGKGILKEKSTFQVIFLAFAVLMIFLPFITTFNEFLTKVIERFQFYIVLEDYVVPYLSRLVGVILIPFGFHIIGTPEGLLMPEKSLAINIAWNCIGWQSMILIIITLITGLHGHYSKLSKAQCILIGITGTFLINIIRIATVVLFAVYFGYFPAIIYHDYFSNLLIILWLFFFWWFSYAFVLEATAFRPGLIIKTSGKKSRFGLRLPFRAGEFKNKWFSNKKTRKNSRIKYNKHKLKKKRNNKNIK